MAPGTVSPGVFVRGTGGGLRPIVGVATSITAFVGRARRGPVDRAATITSVADFERVFGGLWSESALGVSVRDFFQHGGSKAVVVRVHKSAPDDTARIVLGSGTSQLTLAAASPGAWGGALSAEVDLDVTDPTDPALFNLTVSDAGTGEVESFRDVSFDPASRRRVDRVLQRRSELVRGHVLPTAQLEAGSATATDGNDGGAVDADNYMGNAGRRGARRGLHALDRVDLVNLIVIPPYTAAGDVEQSVIAAAVQYAGDRRAFLIMDPPSRWTTKALAEAGAADPADPAFTRSPNAAIYFPRIRRPDPELEGELATVAPSGVVAGVIARTDATRGVWKAPAGMEATLRNVAELSVPLTDSETGDLNVLGVNCLKQHPAAGHVVWGARTRAGVDGLNSEWKYVPVRRTALFIEESVDRGTRWVVFAPNDEPTWAQIRHQIEEFLDALYHRGAFQGEKPRDAYFVKCDSETTTQGDRERGIVNIVVGFAPLKPAEFVIFRIGQKTGQIPG